MDKPCPKSKKRQYSPAKDKVKDALEDEKEINSTVPEKRKIYGLSPQKWRTDQGRDSNSENELDETVTESDEDEINPVNKASQGRAKVESEDEETNKVEESDDGEKSDDEMSKDDSPNDSDEPSGPLNEETKIKSRINPYFNQLSSLDIINVDFEANPPLPEDMEGIIPLLNESSLQGSNIDLHALAKVMFDFIYVTTVLTQAQVDPDEEDDGEPGDETIYALCTLLPFVQAKKYKIISDISEFLLKTCKTYGSTDLFQRLTDILACKTKNSALILSERIINMLAESTVPMLLSLEKDFRDAIKENKLANVEYYIVIAKIQRHPKKGDVYVHSEEENFVETSEFYFDYPGPNPPSSEKYKNYRRVIVIKKSNYFNELKLFHKTLLEIKASGSK